MPDFDTEKADADLNIFPIMIFPDLLNVSVGEIKWYEVELNID